MAAVTRAAARGNEHTKEKHNKHSTDTTLNRVPTCD